MLVGFPTLRRVKGIYHMARPARTAILLDSSSQEPVNAPLDRVDVPTRKRDLRCTSRPHLWMPLGTERAYSNCTRWRCHRRGSANRTELSHPPWPALRWKGLPRWRLRRRLNSGLQVWSSDISRIFLTGHVARKRFRYLGIGGYVAHALVIASVELANTDARLWPLSSR